MSASRIFVAVLVLHLAAGEMCFFGLISVSLMVVLIVFGLLQHRIESSLSRGRGEKEGATPLATECVVFEMKGLQGHQVAQRLRNPT